MEKWKIVDESNGNYEVSNLGRVRNRNTGKILKPILKNGYYQVNFAYGIDKWFLIHRLVAKAFVENPHEYAYFNHIDENKRNNNFENLEWCSAQYNATYGIGALARNHKVIQKNRNGSIVKVWNSLKEASEHLGVHYQSISRVCRGERKTLAGFKWEYAGGKS